MLHTEPRFLLRCLHLHGTQRGVTTRGKSGPVCVSCGQGLIRAGRAAGQMRARKLRARGQGGRDVLVLGALVRPEVTVIVPKVAGRGRLGLAKPPSRDGSGLCPRSCWELVSCARRVFVCRVRPLCVPVLGRWGCTLSQAPFASLDVRLGRCCASSQAPVGE